MNFALLFKLIRFGIVGASGTVLDFFVTWLCKEKLRWNKFIANSLGFALSATSNYVLNRIWTFSSTDTHVAKEYLTFIGVSIIGLILNTIFLYIFNEKIKLNFYISKALAIGLVMIWNFLANNYITFA